MADWMTRNATVKRDNAHLQATLKKLHELSERYQHISLDDRTQFANQTYIFAAQFGPMLELAKVIVKGALLRDEFRGAHFKPEFPKRDDEHWLKTTIARFDSNYNEPLISYEPVDLRHLKPSMRDYSKAKKVKPTLENIPANVILPV
jgi:succinate dehydrogenase / fumarate reductase flavoprotein subunit